MTNSTRDVVSRYTQKQRKQPIPSSTHCTTILRLSFFSPLVFFRALFARRGAGGYALLLAQARGCMLWCRGEHQGCIHSAGTVISIFSFCKRFPLCMQAKVWRYLSTTLGNGLHLLCFVLYEGRHALSFLHLRI